MKLTTEDLIEKGVKRHFDGQKVSFELESLRNHYDGVGYYEVDAFEIEGKEGKYIDASDIHGDDIVPTDYSEPIEVEEQVVETPETEDVKAKEDIVLEQKENDDITDTAEVEEKIAETTEEVKVVDTVDSAKESDAIAPPPAKATKAKSTKK